MKFAEGSPTNNRVVSDFPSYRYVSARFHHNNLNTEQGRSHGGANTRSGVVLPGCYLQVFEI